MSISTLIFYAWFITAIILFTWMLIEKIRDVLGFNSITLDEATKVACQLAEKNIFGVIALLEKNQQWLDYQKLAY